MEYEVAMDDKEGDGGLADGDSDEEDEEEMEDGGKTLKCHLMLCYVIFCQTIFM